MLVTADSRVEGSPSPMAFTDHLQMLINAARLLAKGRLKGIKDGDWRLGLAKGAGKAGARRRHLHRRWLGMSENRPLAAVSRPDRRTSR